MEEQQRYRVLDQADVEELHGKSRDANSKLELSLFQDDILQSARAELQRVLFVTGTQEIKMHGKWAEPIFGQINMIYLRNWSTIVARPSVLRILVEASGDSYSEEISGCRLLILTIASISPAYSAYVLQCSDGWH